MSFSVSSPRETRTFWSVIRLIACRATEAADLSWSRRRGGVPRLTAMMTSQPASRATSTGRFRTMPPST